jgi:hypothetical protein
MKAAVSDFVQTERLARQMYEHGLDAIVARAGINFTISPAWSTPARWRATSIFRFPARGLSGLAAPRRAPHGGQCDRRGTGTPGFIRRAF